MFERLARGLGGSELQSLLLEVMRERARARTPAEVLQQYRRDPFSRPSAIDQRTLVEIDGHLLAAAEGFEAIELSPVAPLGTCSTIALIDQHRVLSALRGTEGVSDPTNVLALECAERLRVAPKTPVHLATSQRVIRAQPVPKLPGYAQHFRIFVLGSAARERADHGFAVEALVLHIRAMMRALDRLEAHGYRFGARRVDLKTTPERAAIGDRVAAELADLTLERKPLEHAYYAGVRYNIWVTAPNGEQTPLIDGGICDWVARLTSNRKHAYVVTGMGAQLVADRFRARPRGETSTNLPASARATAETAASWSAPVLTSLRTAPRRNRARTRSSERRGLAGRPRTRGGTHRARAVRNGGQQKKRRHPRQWRTTRGSR